MVWLSVREVMGLPPKQSRRRYSETEIPAASACLASLSFSSALIRRVRRHAKRARLSLFSFRLSSFLWSVRSEAPNARSPEAKPLAGCYVCRQTGVILQGKTLLGGFKGFGLFPLTDGFWCFRFWEDIYRKNDIVCQQKRKLLSIGFLWTNIYFVKNKKWKIFQNIKKSFLSRYIRE